MTDTRANKLISMGLGYEITNPSDTDRLFDVFTNQTTFVNIPGGANHYQIGELKHADTRSLFLMFLGAHVKVMAE